eukprot:15431265-Alexandrium_andersonii.AAC.1
MEVRLNNNRLAGSEEVCPTHGSRGSVARLVNLSECCFRSRHLAWQRLWATELTDRPNTYAIEPI